MLVSLVQSEVIARSLNIYVVAKPTRFKKGPCCWMLYELVQPSGVSKSEWVLRPSTKFQTKMDIFSLGLRECLFLKCLSLPIPLVVSPLGNPEAVFSVLSGLKPRQWTELPLTTACLELSQGSWLWWGPNVGLGVLQSCVGISVPWEPDQHWKWLKKLMQNVLWTVGRPNLLYCWVLRVFVLARIIQNSSVCVWYVV